MSDEVELMARVRASELRVKRYAEVLERIATDYYHDRHAIWASDALHEDTLVLEGSCTICGHLASAHGNVQTRPCNEGSCPCDVYLDPRRIPVAR